MILVLPGCASDPSLPKLNRYDIIQEGSILTINQPGDYLFLGGVRIRVPLPAGWRSFEIQKEKSKCVGCAPFGREDAYALFISDAKSLSLKAERLWDHDWTGKNESFITLQYRRCTPPYTVNLYSQNIRSDELTVVQSDTVKIAGFDGLMNTYMCPLRHHENKIQRRRLAVALLQFRDRVLEFSMESPSARFESDYRLFLDLLSRTELAGIPASKYMPYDPATEAFVNECVKNKCFSEALNRDYTFEQYKLLAGYLYPAYKKQSEAAVFLYIKALSISPGEKERTELLSFLGSAYEREHNREFLLEYMNLYMSQILGKDPDTYEKLKADYETLQEAP